MSKQAKDFADNGGPADLTVDAAGNDSETMPFSSPQPERKTAQPEQSRQFNAWLDHTLPRLMQYLGAATSSAVTSPGAKAKH